MTTLTQPFSNIEKTVFENNAKYGNFILIGGIGLVVLLMIIPLPAMFFDLLLAINMVAALSILLVSISAKSPMAISTFPTLLLISTLFRLGLNLASTRLILSHGYAGHVIETFGNFATGGNILIGVLMFLILTIIQFVVVSKGAERVAEVGARFSLDAMPGKQMSIDADLRAGLINQKEAKTLRSNLHRESKMYGSMDGAMKFVKGDTIAGLIIIFINILGGLFTGVLSRGMGFSEAAHVYTVMTIGDGLVNQIPALLLAITAGFVVTRVSDDSEEKSLGSEIGFQLFSQPQALLIASGFALLLGLIPGFPFLLFALVALALGGFSFYLTQTIKLKAALPTPVEAYVITPDDQMSESFGQALPLVLEVGPELYRIFNEDTRWNACLGELYENLKGSLTNRLGVLFPDIKLTVAPNLSQTFRYRIKIYDVPVDYGILNPKHCSLIGEPERIHSLPIEAPTNTTETVHGTPMALWELQKQQSLLQTGIPVYGPEEMLIRHLERVLKTHAGDFVGIQEVKNLLTILENQYPELVREVVPRMLSIQKLTEIIKRLVEEGVPIKDFRLILQTLSCCQPESKDPVTLTEQVRVGLRRTITFLHVKESNQLPVITVDGQLEDEVRRAIQINGTECYLALHPETIQKIIVELKKTLSRGEMRANECVLITNLDVRRYFKKIIEEELPDLAVLSFKELDPKVLIKQVGQIQLEGV